MPLVRIKPLLAYCYGQDGGIADAKRKEKHKIKTGRKKLHVIVRYQARKAKGAVGNDGSKKLETRIFVVQAGKWENSD